MANLTREWHKCPVWFNMLRVTELGLGGKRLGSYGWHDTRGSVTGFMLLFFFWGSSPTMVLYVDTDLQMIHIMKKEILKSHKNPVWISINEVSCDRKAAQKHLFHWSASCFIWSSCGSFSACCSECFSSSLHPWSGRVRTSQIQVHKDHLLIPLTGLIASKKLLSGFGSLCKDCL